MDRNGESDEVCVCVCSHCCPPPCAMQCCAVLCAVGVESRSSMQRTLTGDGEVASEGEQIAIEIEAAHSRTQHEWNTLDTEAQMEREERQGRRQISNSAGSADGNRDNRHRDGSDDDRDEQYTELIITFKKAGPHSSTSE